MAIPIIISLALFFVAVVCKLLETWRNSITLTIYWGLIGASSSVLAYVILPEHIIWCIVLAAGISAVEYFVTAVIQVLAVSYFNSDPRFLN